MLPLTSGQLWRGRTVSSAFKDQIALQRALNLAEHTIDAPCLKDIYTRPCKNKARRITKDPDYLYSLAWVQTHQATTKRSIYPQATQTLCDIVSRCMGTEIIITGQKTT